MQTRQGYTFQSLRAVQDFLTAHADKLGTIPSSGTRKKLDIQIATLDEHATRQCASNLLSQGATQRLYALRESLLIDVGLPQDFVSRLRAAADAMLASIDARTEQRGSRQGATKGLKETIRSARKIVDVLDALVSIALKDNVALLASWDSVKRPAVKILVYRDVGADMEVDGLTQVRPPGLVRRVA